MATTGLFENISTNLPDELFTELLSGGEFRIERIVSHGHSSPEGFWYDQQEHEWVLILQGEAKVLLEGEKSPRHLKPGDHLSIPAHCKHRVEWTSEQKKTIWLAVFYSE